MYNRAGKCVCMPGGGSVDGFPYHRRGQSAGKTGTGYIEGQLRMRKWQDQSGQNRHTTGVVVNVGGAMQMPGGRQSGSGQHLYPPGGNTVSPTGLRVSLL